MVEGSKRDLRHKAFNKKFGPQTDRERSLSRKKKKMSQKQLKKLAKKENGDISGEVKKGDESVEKSTDNVHDNNNGGDDSSELDNKKFVDPQVDIKSESGGDVKDVDMAISQRNCSLSYDDIDGGNMQYSNIRLKQYEGEECRKLVRGKNYTRMLNTIEGRQRYLERIKKLQPDMAAKMQLDDRWNLAMHRAEGYKVIDDTKKLKMLVKKRIHKRKRSKEQWEVSSQSYCICTITIILYHRIYLMNQKVFISI